MTDMKGAIAAAFREFNEIFGPRAKDPLLESVEMGGDLEHGQMHWVVTIGFNVLETQPLTPLEEVMLQAKGLNVQDRKTLRRYSRAFNVNMESGMVDGLKAVEA